MRPRAPGRPASARSPSVAGHALRLVLATGSAVCAIMVAGCGGADTTDARDARRAVERFDAAITDGRGAEACAVLSDAAAEAVEDRTGTDCPSAIARVAAAGQPVVRAQAFITTGEVERRDGEHLYLDHGRRGWRITAFGCRSQEGRPAHRPLQCDIEA